MKKERKRMRENESERERRVGKRRWGSRRREEREVRGGEEGKGDNWKSALAL